MDLQTRLKGWLAESYRQNIGRKALNGEEVTQVWLDEFEEILASSIDAMAAAESPEDRASIKAVVAERLEEQIELRAAYDTAEGEAWVRFQFPVRSAVR